LLTPLAAYALYTQWLYYCLDPGRFDLYFYNTIYVTATSLLLILLFGSLAAYALAKWKSRVTKFLYIFFIAGMMIPIRLGTIDLVRMMKALNLLNTLWSLIPVYVAMGMRSPLSY